MVGMVAWWMEGIVRRLLKWGCIVFVVVPLVIGGIVSIFMRPTEPASIQLPEPPRLPTWTSTPAEIQVMARPTNTPVQLAEVCPEEAQKRYGTHFAMFAYGFQVNLQSAILVELEDMPHFVEELRRNRNDLAASTPTLCFEQSHNQVVESMDRILSDFDSYLDGSISTDEADSRLGANTLAMAAIIDRMSAIIKRPSLGLTSMPTLTPVLTQVTPLLQSVANAIANLRAGPGTNFDVVGQTQPGQALIVVAQNRSGDWYRLDDGAWIASFLVDNAPVNLSIIDVATPVVVQPIATAAPVIVQPTLAPIPVVIQPTQSTAVCSCSGNIYNCPAFNTHSEAQACFNYCVAQGRGDIHQLDSDDDGIACENLP